MLSRFISRSSSNLRLLTLISSNTSLHSPPLPPPSPQSSFSLVFNPNSKSFFETSRCFSSNRNNNGDDSTKDPNISNSWRISLENDDNGESIFGDDGGDLSGIVEDNGHAGFDDGSKKGMDDESGSTDWLKRGDEFEAGNKAWSFEEEKGEVFDIGEATGSNLNVKDEFARDETAERETAEAKAKIEKEVEEFSAQLKGPNRAFGDLIAASGITDVMLDSLIALKDLEGIEGLPPLRVIEDIRLEKNERKSTNAELERKKQEEIAKSRVRQVDEKGRAYGTGRRKCSVARVWIQPGEGKFIVNDKPFDTYFPILDHRADLLRPFSETQTLGLWDVNCTVKGGGVSGQVGAIRLGISRALQNFEPGLRPNLRSAGFLTRDSRVVERKKPGKAKARKSFQWVKR